jgi:hypothetical protein
MENPMMRKFDNHLTGILVGLLLPTALYLIFIMPKMHNFRFLDDYYTAVVIKSLPLFLTRCIFPNALLFFILIWKNYLKIARGILISTAVLTAALVVINFIL